MSTKLSIDVNGLPCFIEETIYGKKVVYNQIFLGNTGMASALGNVSTRYMEQVYALLLELNHQVNFEFEKYYNHILNESKNIESFLRDEKINFKYSDLDILIYKCKEDKKCSFINWYREYIVSKGYKELIKKI